MRACGGGGSCAKSKCIEGEVEVEVAIGGWSTARGNAVGPCIGGGGGGGWCGWCALPLALGLPGESAGRGWALVGQSAGCGLWFAARAFSSGFSLSSFSMSAGLEVGEGAAESCVAFEIDKPSRGSVPFWGTRAAALGGGELRAAGDANGGEARGGSGGGGGGDWNPTSASMWE